MATCQRSLLSRPRIFSAPIPARAAFSTITTTVRPYKQARLGERGQRTTILTRFSSHRLGCAVVDIRKASTSSASPSQQTPPENILTWDRFFDLRRRRRWINLGSSVVTAATAVGVVTPILAQQDIDSWGAQISGLDPIIVLGISTFAVAAGGWLCGPSFGTAVFSLWAGRRGWNRLITEVSCTTKSLSERQRKSSVLTICPEREIFLRPYQTLSCRSISFEPAKSYSRLLRREDRQC